MNRYATLNGASLVRGITFAIFGLYLAISIAFAQGGAGELTGLVTDPTGAVVPNVQVTLMNPATGEKKTTVTTPAGIYRFVALPVVGTYILEASPQGFRAQRVANIVVSVGIITRRDIRLEVGTGAETVTVEGGAQLVQTEEASISQLVDRRVWESMPLESRSQNEFINLIAGAEPEAFNMTFRGASVNGTRSGTGNYLIEGADNNEQGQGGVALQGPGGANTSISPDAIQEYRVITHDFPAEYGKAGGFVTDTVLKSGTNNWHGSAFEYNRLQDYTANDWFSNQAGIQDHLVRNQFGGSLGGPIVKDKTFFYAGGEIHRLRQSTPITATGTTQQFLDFVNNGGFENFMENDPNGVCVVNLGKACPGALNLSSSLGPVFQQLRAKQVGAFPVAQATVSCNPALGANGNDQNCLGQGAYTGPAFNFPQIVYPVQLYGTVVKSDAVSTDQSRFDVKLDHKLSEKDHVSFTYLFDDVQSTDSNGGADSTIGAGDVVPSRAQNASIKWTRNISNTILNQAQFGYQRRVANFTSPEAVGIPAIATFIDPIGTSLGASAAIPQFFTENQFQYKDDLSISRGKHNVKLGFEYRRTRNSSKFLNDRYGTVDPWSIEDLVTDLTFTDQLDNVLGAGFGSCAICGASIDPRNGFLPDYQRNYRANEYGAFGQDDWRVTSRLTLNLGLRWDYFGPPHNANPGLDSNFYFGAATTPISTTSNNPFFPKTSPFFARVATGTFQTRQPLWNQDLNNFGPRVGFAWDPTGTQKLVVRGGFGIMYDRIYNNVFENIRFNPPQFADISFGLFGATGTPAGALATPGFYAIPFVANANGSLNGTPFKASPRHMDQNLVTPYYEQMHFGLEYGLTKTMVLETDYVGTLGRKLIGILNDNTFDGRVACSNAPYDPGTPCFDAGFPDGFGTTRVNTSIGADNFRTNAFGSNYHALQVSLRKNYSFGLQLNGSYTYGKTLDEVSDAFRAKSVAFNPCAQSDCQNPHLDYGPADFDVRHRAVVSYDYDLPLAKGNRWLGGWQVNGVFSWQTGVPVPIFDLNNDLNADGQVGGDRPFYAAGFNGKNVTTNRSAGIQFLNPSGYLTASCPANVNLGLWCDSPMHRNDVYGPHFVDWDFGLGKSFRITEGSKVTFFANFFNIFNHPNFDTPQGNFSDPLFGKSTQTLTDNGGHRIGQLALRFDF